MHLSRFLSFGLGLGLLGLWAAPALAIDGAAERAKGRAVRRTPVVEAVERAAPSVVSIGTTRLVRAGRWWDWDFLRREEVPGALGSGVIVHPRGYVVTNAHVIEQAESITVKMTGMESALEIGADLVSVDLDHDLALLRLTAPGPYPAAKFGRTDDMMVGETVIAMGSPFGLGRTVTTGVVSARERDINIRDQTFEGLIQTDAAVNQGNSGGALLNILGEWIGVNSAIYSLSGGSDGISFAIPIETVRDFLVRAVRPRRIINRWIGMELAERPDGGVEVGKVYAAGPAARAKLQPGTRILTAGGKPAKDAVEVAFALLDAVDKGAVAFGVEDARGSRAVRLEFEDVPTPRLAWQRLGLRAVEVDAVVAKNTGYREGAGLVVESVRKDSPAARIGLRRGDLMIWIGGARVRNHEDVLALLDELRTGDVVDVRLLRPQRSSLGRVQYESLKARLVAD